MKSNRTIIFVALFLGLLIIAIPASLIGYGAWQYYSNNMDFISASLYIWFGGAIGFAMMLIYGLATGMFSKDKTKNNNG